MNLYMYHVIKTHDSQNCENRPSTNAYTYRDEIYSLQNFLSRTQAGPGRTVKREQEEISPNHVQRINLSSVKGVRNVCGRVLTARKRIL